MQPKFTKKLNSLSALFWVKLNSLNYTRKFIIMILSKKNGLAFQVLNDDTLNFKEHINSSIDTYFSSKIQSYKIIT